VADEKQDTPRPFDVKTVEYLLRLMSDHELSEVDLKEGDQRIRLRKGSLAAPVAYSPPPVAPPSSVPAPPSTPSAPAPPAKSNLLEIKSELPGTFYARPAPDKPEFVKVGSKVTPDTVVCFVSAMKVNTPIQAGVTGTVAEIVAKNDEFVDYGAVLFRVTPG
jgi:acetyl-CoA carboxylase biotin carboxyl carrier protein